MDLLEWDLVLNPNLNDQEIKQRVKQRVTIFSQIAVFF